MLSLYLSHWKDLDKRCVKLGQRFSTNFIDFTNWNYDTVLLDIGYYTNANFPRPYSNPENKKLVDQLLTDLGWEDVIPT